MIPEKDTNTINKYIEYYYNQFPYLWWAPIIFTSAKEDVRSKKILDMILDIEKSKQIELTDSQLSRFLKSQIKKHRGNYFTSSYLTEVNLNDKKSLYLLRNCTTTEAILRRYWKASGMI